MAIETVKLNRDDLQPYYRVTAQDSTGGAINLTGAGIKVIMRPSDSTTLTINSTVGITIVSATAGQFYYAWQAGDTNSTGTYDIQFQITPAAGGKFTLPNPVDGVAKIMIEPFLGTTS